MANNYSNGGYDKADGNLTREQMMNIPNAVIEYQTRNEDGEGDGYGDPNKKNIPSINGSRIVNVGNNEDGDLRSFTTEDGQTYTFDQVKQLMRNGGQITGLILQQGNEGQPVIRSVPDGYSDNNLDNL